MLSLATYIVYVPEKSLFEKLSSFLIYFILVSVYLALNNNIVARQKGRNIAFWTVLGLIPIINIFGSVLLAYLSDLRIETMQKRLLKVETLIYGENPSKTQQD